MPKVFVEIVVGDLRRRTESIKRKENACTWRDAEFALYVSVHQLNVCVLLTQLDSPISNSPSKITFSVLHERVLHDRCLGRFDIDMEELLARQRQQADNGECLLFVKGFLPQLTHKQYRCCSVID